MTLRILAAGLALAAFLILPAAAPAHSDKAPHPAAAKAGALSVTDPFARATPAKNGGVFMTLRNAGAEPDRLVKAAAPVAAAVELHTHLREGDAMRMRPVEAIPVPARGSTTLEPGGLHVMLIGLAKPLKEGERFPLTLTFERAGSITIEVPVLKAGAAAHEHKH